MKVANSDVIHMISECPIHGRYDANNLCACYDEGGSHADVEYGSESQLDSLNFKPLFTTSDGLPIGFCPIHGETTVSEAGIFQCGCFDEHGNKIVHLTDNPTAGDTN